MSSLWSSSCRLNQSHPTRSLSRSADPNSWSIQLVPVTSNDSFPIVSVPVVASLVKE